MIRKIKIATSSSDQSSFSWVRDPEFTPPGKDGGIAACVTHELTPARAGELKALLINFLESIIGTVRATAGVVRLLSPDGHTLQIIGSAGLSAELQEEAESFLELDCEANDTATFGHVVRASDISSCTSRQNCRYTSCRFQSLVAAPLESNCFPGTPFGILTIFFDVPRATANRTTDTVAAFAEIMGAAIEHTRINRESRRMERIAARQDIANDIHDSLAQTLTYARMRVSLLAEAIRTGNELMASKYARELDETLEISQKNTRDLISDFRCEFNPGGLFPALQTLVTQFRERNNIHLEYYNRLVDQELPLEHEIQTYHIVQEALTNIARHSGASHARLFVDANFGYYIFTIEDNGSGACTFTPVEGHYGVMIMRERAQRIGGEIKVASSAGLGTQVQLFFPAPTLDWRSVNE
ncbi:MAG: histidine kinase [Gallionella sp.]|nr:histidine kinase [Gallionella sp.]